ncbi:5'-3' exonuclease [Chondromyces apiculatus]|uniref:DNA polymerase I n=1 Tax=Chondromyces apiculatus DSM 436 TaxID=1192034 RepID=A0A017SUW8_9BACT|nr:5'-3' exonuclease H3TH domain-containing protein [Chondromyces apiculatus]EYF00798.1 DNA polymerase I [Chondromyces apiculatus DSM 436]
MATFPPPGDATRPAPGAAVLPPPGADDAVYLVDIAGWIHRAFHAMPPITSPRGEPIGAVSGVAGMLVRLLVDRRPGYLAAAIDPLTPSFRQELFPAYKACRPPRHPDIDPQFALVHRLLEAHRIPVLMAPGFEADDLLATATARARLAGLRVVIVTHDKDLCQLATDNIVIWDGRERVMGPEEVRARWGVGPELLGDLLALAGDASDGIPGIPGVGAKTAAELLQKRGSLDAILHKADWESSRTLRAKLRRHADEARLSRSLVALRTDAPITFDLTAWRVGWGDPEPIRSFYEEIGLTRLAGEVTPLHKLPVPPQVLALGQAPQGKDPG